MLRNKLVSVVVNLWRAHFNFIWYDGYFLYRITGKPMGTKWIDHTLHTCLIAFYLIYLQEFISVHAKASVIIIIAHTKGFGFEQTKVLKY